MVFFNERDDAIIRSENENTCDTTRQERQQVNTFFSILYANKEKKRKVKRNRKRTSLNYVPAQRFGSVNPLDLWGVLKFIG